VTYINPTYHATNAAAAAAGVADAGADVDASVALATRVAISLLKAPLMSSSSSSSSSSSVTKKASLEFDVSASTLPSFAIPTSLENREVKNAAVNEATPISLSTSTSTSTSTSSFDVETGDFGVCIFYYDWANALALATEVSTITLASVNH
jgi:hypothetical protein